MSSAQMTVSPDMTGQQMREYYLEQTRRSLAAWEQDNWSISDSPPFDLDSDSATSFTFTPELAKKINLRYQVEVFAEEAKVSTAGVRENQNVLCPWDHRYRINEYMFCLLAEAQTRLVRELHDKRMADIPLASEESVREKLGDAAAKVVEEIFGRSLAEVIELVRSTPVRAVGGEVRSNTPRFTDLMSRIYAAHGLPVLLTEDDHCKDTSNIYLWSFLVFYLGLSGGDYFTSSHGAPQKQSDKILAPDGAQFLPPLYSKIVDYLFEILGEIEKDGYTIKLAARDDKNLIRTLSYSRLAKIYGDYLRTGPATANAIGKVQDAANSGLRLGLDFFGGSGYKSLDAIFRELGIEKVFDGGYIRTEEDSFFHNIGFRVGKKKDGSGYEVVHDSVDASVPGVVRSANYEELLKDTPVGRMVFNVDPDADRFVVGQVLPRSEEQALNDIGISYIELGPQRVFAILSPNQFFLLLAENDRLIAQEDGSWNESNAFDIHTYVSALAWDEWAEHHKIPVVRVPVGFKEIAAIVRQVEVQMKKSDGDVIVTAEAGQEVNLGAKPKLHHAGEESGGKIGGPVIPVPNVLGQEIVAVREKSSGEACVSAVSLAARMYLEGGKDEPEKMFLNRLLAQVFEASGVQHPMEYRGDIIHYNEAIFDPKLLAEAKKKGIAERVEFNRWFEELAADLQSGKKSLEETQERLSSAIPGLKELWAKLESITIWSDGLQFWFAKGNQHGIRDICVRPSGTDAKTKIYFDGTDKKAMQETFEGHLRDFRP